MLRAELALRGHRVALIDRDPINLDADDRPFADKLQR
jgi:hypothetical protein